MPYTKEQELAINDRNHDILVSASAGSGKTTVLVQRVLKEIISGVGVDQLLIVTFTKAAAAEMKDRIKRELLRKMYEPDSDKVYLKNQLNNVDTANISTIDAFCLDVIHRFYYAVDIDPSFNILTDETQAALLKERALKDIETEFLENKDEDFLAFYDNFAGDRDAEGPRNLLLDLYNFAMAKPDYRQWLQQLPNDYALDDQTLVKADLWQKELKQYLSTLFSDLKKKNDALLETSFMESKELAKVRDSFTIFQSSLTNYLEALTNDESFDHQREALRSCVFVDFRISKKWPEDIQEFYQQDIMSFKQEAKDLIFNTFATIYINSEDEQQEILQKAHKIVKAISKAELALIDRFNALKREQNYLDFTDMEQLAYEILSQDTSNAKLAQEFYQSKFKEILVDEYQDINELQERIIQLLKDDKQNTLFMVGDVKQSIYGFRQAEPSLFLKKYHDFGNSDQSKKMRIILKDNFRSSRPVVSLVNDIFNTIMTTDFGGIDYTSEGQLIFGASYYPEKLEQSSEIIYHKKESGKATENDESDDISYSEVQMVIERINQFKREGLQIYDAKTGESRDFRYSDIAILTRSRSNNLDIMQEFAQSNIPLFVSDAANYFQTFELTVIMNYLKIIDNPDQDIPLVSVLRSPIFSFNEPELAKIRINNKQSSFYQALLSYISVNDDLSIKIKNFLNQLESLRDFAVSHRISELIWSVYERTGLLEIMTALPNGKQRRVNLETLYERAASYESAGFKGLYQFINFIERMRRSQKDLAQPLLSQEAENAVKLMTIHGSKGLEFPIVFYIGLEHRYQTKDLTGDYVINSTGLGISVKQDHYRADSLLKALGNIEKRRQIIEEESRILYVALTRAKQKLVLVTEIPGFDKKVAEWSAKPNQKQMILQDKLNAKCPLDFVGQALAFDKHASQKISEISKELDQKEEVLYLDFNSDEYQQPEPKKLDKDTETSNSLLLKTSNRLFDFNYKFKDASTTTAYQAVSEIKRIFNDPVEVELENAHMDKSNNRFLQPIDTRPAFLFNDKFTGADIGTATHTVLQYYDYTLDASDQQLELEIQQLVDQHKLNPNIIPHLHLDQIKWFVRGEFAQKFRENPDKLFREIDFSSLLPAKKLFDDFSDENAKILVHGTIDGYFVEDDGIILFDYKTDYVDKKNLDSAIELIKQKYQGQLRLYEQALTSFSNLKVKAKYLILLDAQEIVEIV